MLMRYLGGIRVNVSATHRGKIFRRFPSQIVEQLETLFEKRSKETNANGDCNQEEPAIPFQSKCIHKRI